MATTVENVPQTTPRPGQITLTIDGQEVICERGDTILDAAQRIGIHIPTLCYEPRLPATAACRMCIVEVEGAPTGKGLERARGLIRTDVWGAEPDGAMRRDHSRT